MKLWVGLGALNAALAVMAGAFGAHALRARLTVDRLAVFETAARYHMYHALGLIAVGWFAATRGPVANTAGACMTAGIVVFCGSLYALALTGMRWLGAITPLGGLGFIAGWLALAWAAWRST